MAVRRRLAEVALVLLCLGLGVAVAIQLHGRPGSRSVATGVSWETVISDMLDSNSELRQEIQMLQSQIGQLGDTQGGGPLLEALVNEVNQLRIANGLIEVSGEGIEVVITGPISVLDLQDLLNELRNAGAEALSVGGQRLVARSAISTDGEAIRVDGQPVGEPIYLQAIGDAQALDVAVARPGGLVSLLRQARADVSITVRRGEKLTIPLYGQDTELEYARPVE